MTQHFLLFDIGNTNVKIGIAVETAVLTSYVLPTDPGQTADSIGLRLLEVLRHAGLGPSDVGACVASSVVPGVNPLIRRACERYLYRKLLFAPGDIAIPLENRYERPAEVGADRLVAAYAARRLYPGPGRWYPLISAPPPRLTVWRGVRILAV